MTYETSGYQDTTRARTPCEGGPLSGSVTLMRRGVLVVLTSSLVVGCGQSPETTSTAELVFDAAGAVVSGCVTEHEPGRDYFPAKARVQDAELFRISYHGSYKLLDIDAAGAPGDTARYLLVQCGTPVPEGHEDRTLVRVPAARLAVTHSYLQEAIVLLGAVDRLVGVQRAEYAAAPEIRSAMESGAILPVGAGHHTDIEVISALEPDAVVVYEPFYAESTMLTELGVPVIPSSDGREPTMLGATEWMMVVAALLNREADMERILDETRSRYQALADHVRDVEHRPHLRRRATLSRLLVPAGWSGELGEAHRRRGRPLRAVG